MLQSFGRLVKTASGQGCADPNLSWLSDDVIWLTI
jgi:hypothetical protein